MLPRRLGSAVTVLAWLCAMTWLITTKIVPSYRAPGERGYHELLSQLDDQHITARWRILWDGRPIGEADYLMERQHDGGAMLRSKVEFRQLPVAQLMESFLGGVVHLMPADVRQEMNVKLDATVDTVVHFDAYNHLMDIEASAGLAGSPPMLTIRGTQANGILRVHSRMTDDDRSVRGISYVTEIPMEADGFQIDALAPLPRLQRLQVGQTWLQRTLRPLSTNTRWETVRAEVVSWDEIEWDGKRQGAYCVEFATETAGSLSVTQRPVGKMWVLRDGRVVRQQLRLASVTLEFERIP